MFPPQAGGQTHTVNSQSSLNNSGGPVFPVPFVTSSASIVPLPFSFGPSVMTNLPNPSPCPHVGAQQSANAPSSAAQSESSPNHGRNGTTPRQMPAATGSDGMPPGMQIPIIPPHFPAGSTDLLPADPYLPCHSRHFLSRRAAARAAGQSDAGHQVIIGLVFFRTSGNIIFGYTLMLNVLLIIERLLVLSYNSVFQKWS